MANASVETLILPLLPPEDLAARLGAVEHARSHSAEFGVQPAVVAEVEKLLLAGYDVALEDTVDTFPRDPADEKRTTRLIEDMERADEKEAGAGAAMFRKYPGVNAWAPLTKRAIALHALYTAGDAKTLGDGIAPNAYDRPLFPVVDDEGETRVVSAREVVKTEKSPAKAEDILSSYEEFLRAPMDETTRDIFLDSKDGKGIRTRAVAAMSTMVREHIYRSPEMQHRQDLVSASLACGAAGPIFELIKTLEGQGSDFARSILVDQDAMALASAYALAETHGVADKVQIEKRDLLTTPLTEYIEPGSVDIVDLLGLFEYIPNDERRGRWAAELLRRAGEIVRPGGLIVFGNMLADRPQQRFFNKVVKWPRLYQRTISESLDIIAEAGFDLADVTARIPSHEGVYGVYGIHVPTEVQKARRRHTQATAHAAAGVATRNQLVA